MPLLTVCWSTRDLKGIDPIWQTEDILQVFDFANYTILQIDFSLRKTWCSNEILLNYVYLDKFDVSFLFIIVLTSSVPPN